MLVEKGRWYRQQILSGACYCLYKFLCERKKVSVGILMRFYKTLKGAIGKMQLKVIFMVRVRVLYCFLPCMDRIQSIRRNCTIQSIIIIS